MIALEKRRASFLSCHHSFQFHPLFNRCSYEDIYVFFNRLNIPSFRIGAIGRHTRLGDICNLVGRNLVVMNATNILLLEKEASQI